MRHEHTILIFGVSHATAAIAKNLLKKRLPFLVVDNKEWNSEIPKDEFIEFKVADFQDDDVLVELGISQGVELVFALFNEDYENVFLVLSARNLDKNLKIAAITHAHDTIHKLNAAGADTILDPYQISGKKLYELVKEPDVANVMENLFFKESRLVINEIHVTKGTKLDGMMLEELDRKNSHNVLILGIHDLELHREFIFVTEGLRHKIDYGDVIVVLGEKKEIMLFVDEFC